MIEPLIVGLKGASTAGCAVFPLLSRKDAKKAAENHFRTAGVLAGERASKMVANGVGESVSAVRPAHTFPQKSGENRLACVRVSDLTDWLAERESAWQRR